MQTPIQTAIRSIISPVVAVTFAVVGVTGVMMLAHIRNGALNKLHEGTGFTMLVAGLIHLVINWRVFVSLFRYKRALVACGLAAALSVSLFVAGSMQKGRRQGGPPCVANPPASQGAK